MVAHALVCICMFLMRLEPRVRRFGESDGFDSRWADVDEQGKCGWVGEEASEWCLDGSERADCGERDTPVLDRAVVEIASI
jgi:hypothetical protein